MVALPVPVDRHLQMLHDRHQKLHVPEQPVVVFDLAAMVSAPPSSSERSSVDFISSLATLPLCHPTHSGWPPPLAGNFRGGGSYLSSRLFGIGGLGFSCRLLSSSFGFGL